MERTGRSTTHPHYSRQIKKSKVSRRHHAWKKAFSPRRMATMTDQELRGARFRLGESTYLGQILGTP
jgi:hypothetical protein